MRIEPKPIRQNEIATGRKGEEVKYVLHRYKPIKDKAISEDECNIFFCDLKLNK